MRATFLVCAALVFCGCLIASHLLRTFQDAGHGLKSPQPAAIVFTARSARQWLEEEQGKCIHAVLRDPAGREGASGD